MKRKELLQHLHKHGCNLIREGKKHSVFYNSANSKTSTMLRHREINEFVVKKICRDLGISEPL